MENNPIIQVSMGDGDFPDPLPSGQYLCNFVEIEHKMMNKWQSEEQEMKLILKFHVVGAEENRINKVAAAKCHPRSALVKIATQMGAPDYAKTDNDGLWSWLNEQIDKEFLIMSEPSDNGRFNNLMGIMPAPEGAKPTKIKAKTKNTTLEQDDIPF